MLYDLKDLYSNAQSISTTGASHTFASTNIKDHGPLATGNTSHNLDQAGLFLNLRVTEAVASTGAATMAVLFTTADNEAMTGASTVFTALPATLQAALAKGAEYSIPLPRGTYKRYTALSFVGAAHIITAGAVIACLADAPGRYTAFAQDASIY